MKTFIYNSVNVKNCIDILVDIKEREEISQGKKVYWLSPGWLKYWRHIFKDWDIDKANETVCLLPELEFSAI